MTSQRNVVFIIVVQGCYVTSAMNENQLFLALHIDKQEIDH